MYVFTIFLFSETYAFRILRKFRLSSIQKASILVSLPAFGAYGTSSRHSRKMVNSAQKVSSWINRLSGDGSWGDPNFAVRFSFAHGAEVGLSRSHLSASNNRFERSRASSSVGQGGESMIGINQLCLTSAQPCVAPASLLDGTWAPHLSVTRMPYAVAILAGFALFFCPRRNWYCIRVSSFLRFAASSALRVACLASGRPWLFGNERAFYYALSRIPSCHISVRVVPAKQDRRSGYDLLGAAVVYGPLVASASGIFLGVFAGCYFGRRKLAVSATVNKCGSSDRWGWVFGEPRRGSMIGINQLRWSATHSRVAQPHR